MTTFSRVLLGLGALLGLAGAPLQGQAPSNLKATIVSSTKVDLTWTPGTGASGHRIYRGVGTVGNATLALIGYVQSPGTTYTDGSAPAGTQLVYQVMAKYPSGPNKYTAKVPVTTPSGGSTASSTPPPSTSTPAPSSAAAVPSSPVITALPPATTNTAVVLRSPTSAVPAGRHAFAVAAEPAPAPAPAPAPVAAVPAPAAPPMPVSARYRVVANGFTVIHESFDDQLSRDGKYDEVYGGFTMLHYDRSTGNVLDRDLRRTKVLGDINNFPDRLRAGSGSGSGGLRAGDSYPDAGHARYRGQDGAEPNSQTFPFKVWEGTLTDGADAAIILPTMWEQDNDGSPYDAWNQAEVASASQIWFDATVQQALRQTSLGVVAPPGSITPNMAPAFGAQGAGALGFFAAIGQPWLAALFAGSRDRPIGMVPGGSGGLLASVGAALPRRAIVLTREIIEHSLNGSRILPDPNALGPGNAWMLAYFDVPVGVIPVLLRDGPSFELQANYVMYLQVERM
ncbi:MAG: fibronectin type III domain-containing protein [Gemmatimonadales bacterium]